MRAWVGRHPRLAFVLVFFGVAILAAGTWVRVRMHGPYRDYRVDIEFVSGPAESRGEPLFVGVGVREITPDLGRYDGWEDANGNGRFEPGKGDRYEDRNGNGDFDLVWLAGFNMNRPAKGTNDPLWARALAFRHREVVVAMVSIDCVGLTHERVIRARLELARELPELRHCVVSSTHTHNAPDTMGIWSYRPLPSKFDEAYVAWVMEQAKEAVKEAVKGSRPATAVVGMTTLEPAGFVRDSRRPLVYDRVLAAARFVRAGTEETIATLVSWGNHPEAMGGDNPLVSSDFPHYLREALERGLEGSNGMSGFSAPCVYFQGPVGGLMTPLGLEVPDRNGREVHRQNGVGKTRALGENLALEVHRLLRGPSARPMEDHRIAVVARTVFAPIEGTFKIPIMLGLIHPGWFDGKARTEVDALRLGEIEILTIPGEIYPEIVDGGVEAPAGGDHGGPPVEVPPLRPRMRGRANLVLNLANDEVGYIIPRTQWDTRAPFAYGLERAPYGEVNSGGPDVAGVLHREGMGVLSRLHALLGEPVERAAGAGH